MTDLPFVEHEVWGYEALKPDEFIRNLFRAPRSSPSTWSRQSVNLSWALAKRLLASESDAGGRFNGAYYPPSVRELIIVNFPCASFPCYKRYDEGINEEAWGLLRERCVRTQSFLWHRQAGRDRGFRLTLAESASEVSNMERSEEPKYEHTIPESYEAAVRAVTEKGCQTIARYTTIMFEDLRIHSFP